MKVAFYIGVVLTIFGAISCLSWFYDIFIAHSFWFEDITSVIFCIITLIAGIIVIQKTKIKLKK